MCDTYEDYAQTYYSGLDIIPLDLVVDFSSDSFREGLAKGFRFMISHDAPYLIHCTMGKDRAGFTSAVLECLMGASAEEVVADYMVSYYNYYGIGPDAIPTRPWRTATYERAWLMPSALMTSPRPTSRRMPRRT